MNFPTFLTSAVLGLFSAFSSLHAERQTQDLASGWKFIRENVEPAASTFSWTSVTVPHTWNAQDGQKGKVGNPDLKFGYYRGACWYARTLEIPENLKRDRVFIRFEAASIVAKVYLNGELLGEHRGAFTAFCYELTSHLRFGGKNELRVQVDNSQVNDVPPIWGDFNMNGGIYRPVSLIITDPVCVSPLDFASPGVYVTTKSIRKSEAEVEVKTIVSGAGVNSAGLELETVIADAKGNSVAHTTQPVKLGEGGIATVTWNGIKDPYLYSAKVRVLWNKKPVDEVTQSFGVRSVEIAENQGFLLNGNSYPIHGVNRHQERFNQAWALTPENHQEDARLILEMGATAVRNAHYPQSQCWHDLADRNGLLLWDEVSLVDVIRETPEFAANAKLELREMIHQLYNHPSIAFWGIFNELDNIKGPDAVPLLKELKSEIEGLDSSRIVVGATNHANKPYNQVPQALCFNSYPGWYGGKAKNMAGTIHGYSKEFGNRLIALSEYGAGSNTKQHMEGIPSLENAKAPFHPEEWQLAVHEEDYAIIKNNPKVWGSFLWVMFDFAVASRNEGDQPALNDKGMVTEDRQIKKDVFYFYKANWSQEPMVYIASRRMTPRHQAKTEIKIYSNCDQVELRVNGKALDKVSKDKVNRFVWANVELQPGKNLISAKGEIGGKTVADQCEWVLENAPVASTTPNR